MAFPPRPAGSPDEADDQLASAILGGAEVALFENAYAAYSAEARHTAHAFLGEQQLALDAVHNGFLEVLRHLLKGGRWADAAEARAVVLRNTRWAALNLLRTQRRRREEIISAPSPRVDDDALWARWEARALCEEIVAQLRPRQQQALHLHFVEGLSNPEAAGRMGLTTRGYASLLQRAVAAARHAGRRTGFLPGVAWLSGSRVKNALRSPRRHRRPPWPVIAATAKVVATAGAALIALQSVDIVAEPEATVSSVLHVSTAAAPLTATLTPRRLATEETPSDIRFVDAIAVATNTGSGTVLALGAGQQCQCWVVARSTDGGLHWSMAAGPEARAAAWRLAVPIDCPADPRILIMDSTSPNLSLWVSSGFGTAFRKGSTRHAAVANTIHASPYSGTMAGGSALQVGHDLIYFPVLGGSDVTTDAGRSWRPSERADD